MHGGAEIAWPWQVYSPHTAVDAVPSYGLGDWLADICSGNYTKSVPGGLKFPIGGNRASLPGSEHFSDFYLEALREEPGKYRPIKAADAAPAGRSPGGHRRSLN